MRHDPQYDPQPEPIGQEYTVDTATLIPYLRDDWGKLANLCKEQNLENAQKK